MTLCNMARTLTAFLFLAAPAAADPEWSTFFDAPHAEVARTTSITGGVRETVELPGDVKIVRDRDEDGAWAYAGIDFSDGGAVGCMARIFLEIARVGAVCPDLLSDAQTAKLDTHQNRLAAFYARNSVPPVTVDGFLAQIRADVDGAPDLTCADVSGDFRQFAGQLLSPASDALIDDLLAAPRLPVTNPCL